MARLTDEQVEMEIVKLRQSEYVKLAKKEQNIRYERRNLLSQLQGMERRGKELAAAGIDRENIREVLFQDGDFCDEE
jgi:hypothetical protein